MVPIAIDEATHQIFVANNNSDRVEIFSETGEYICQLGVGQLLIPCGISIHGDNVYVSRSNHTVSRFSLTDMSLVKKTVGDQTTDNLNDLVNSQLIQLVVSIHNRYQ